MLLGVLCALAPVENRQSTMKSNPPYKRALTDIINAPLLGRRSLSRAIYYYKSLIINIVRGCAYHRTTQPLPGNQGLHRHYSHFEHQVFALVTGLF